MAKLQKGKVVITATNKTFIDALKGQGYTVLPEAKQAPSKAKQTPKQDLIDDAPEVGDLDLLG